MSEQFDVLVLGSGVAGLTAARELQGRGVHAAVLDKGRRPGGRMATRELPGGRRADHGAQFFTVRGEELGERLRGWLAAGAASLWCNGFQRPDGHPRYAAPGGMAALAEHLASGLDVRQSVHVRSLRRRAGVWRADWAAAHGVPAGGAHAPRVIVTAPLPQARALLDGEDVPPLAYEPVVALLLGLDAAGAVPAPGGVQLRDDPTWTWVADNAAKGASPLPSLTLHTRSDLAHTLLECDPPEVLERLLGAAEPWTGGARVVSAQTHGWRYATPRETLPGRCLPLAGGSAILAGDAFAGARVEGALLSGLAAADAAMAC